MHAAALRADAVVAWLPSKVTMFYGVRIVTNIY